MAGAIRSTCFADLRSSSIASYTATYPSKTPRQLLASRSSIDLDSTSTLAKVTSVAAMDEKVLAASAKYPITAGHVYQYGTAGFRMKADLLPSVSFRVGLLAGLRSRKLNGQAIGVMITASHNPAPDNGIKIVDPMGEMLEQEWEVYATKLVNCATDQELFATYKALATQLKVDLEAPGRVIYGRDTRPSGHGLVVALADALDATGTEHTDFKILTTPQLHYLVRCINTEGTPKSYGKVSEAGYYEKLSEAFVRALRGRKVQGQLIVDCANGVGGPKFTELLKSIPKDVTGFNVKVVNDDVLRPEVLNLDVSRFATTNTSSIRANCLVWRRLCQDETAQPSQPQARSRRPLLLF